MSSHLATLAKAHRLPALRKIVLLMLAHEAVLSTGEVVISTADLSAMCGMSTSSVRVQLRALESTGLVVRDRTSPLRNPVYFVRLAGKQTVPSAQDQ